MLRTRFARSVAAGVMTAAVSIAAAAPIAAISAPSAHAPAPTVQSPADDATAFADALAPVLSGPLASACQKADTAASQNNFDVDTFAQALQAQGASINAASFKCVVDAYKMYSLCRSAHVPAKQCAGLGLIFFLLCIYGGS